MSEIERYNGLTTADKGALLDAKARGAEWVARDEDEELVGFRRKPKRYIDMESTSDHWERTESENYFIAMPNDEPLQFIQWSDAEPVNIDLALAQIAEMEKAQKPSGCGWCNGVTRMSGTFWTDKDENCGGTFDFEFCPNCGRSINSPYTEGETK